MSGEEEDIKQIPEEEIEIIKPETQLDVEEDIKSHSILQAPVKRKVNIIASLKNSINSFMENIKKHKERKALIKSYESEAFKAEKERKAAEKLEKDIALAKQRGEFKAKPVKERIDQRKKEITDKKTQRIIKKATKEAEANKPIIIQNDDGTTTTIPREQKKKGKPLGGLGKGASSMIQAHGEKKKNGMSIKSTKNTNTTESNKVKPSIKKNDKTITIKKNTNTMAIKKSDAKRIWK